MQLIEDLSNLTNISIKDLNKVVENINIIIANDITDNIIENKDITNIDIGIGTLYIKYIKEQGIQYKFIPSTSLEDIIKDSVNSSNNNPLIPKLENNLVERIKKVYQDFL